MKHLFNVYKTVATGTTLRLKNIYSFELIKTFKSRTDAEIWIAKNGNTKTDYIIFEVLQIDN